MLFCNHANPRQTRLVWCWESAFRGENLQGRFICCACCNNLHAAPNRSSNHARLCRFLSGELFCCRVYKDFAAFAVTAFIAKTALTAIQLHIALAFFALPIAVFVDVAVNGSQHFTVVNTNHSVLLFGSTWLFHMKLSI